MLLCSCIDPDEKRCAQIRQGFCPSLDWETFFSFSLHQRMLPIVYLSIKKAIPDLIPKDTLSKFKSAYVSNTRRNLSLTAFLLSILSILSTHKIKVLPFKGPVLAQDIYGDPGLRIFSDLDILVHLKDAVKAWNLFTDKGLIPELSLDDKKKDKYIQTEDHMIFSHKNNGIIVELHWEMSGRYISPFLGLEKIAGHLHPLPILNREVLNLSPEILLLYLCIHGAKENWWYLEQIFSLSRLISRKKDLDWQIVKNLSRRWRCRKMLDLGLLLAKQIFSTPVPEPLVHKRRNDRDIQRNLETILDRFFGETSAAPETPAPGRFSPLHLAVRDSFMEKLSYAARLIFQPTSKEWIHFPLPARLSFLHYGLRPIRLLKEGFIQKNA
ncbi:nucleotidyltransferase domain-containing protein [Desulfospira joergensenii]|uniref:nucleotidyltransferase domain-containing protein n=1 Tax=Desulfospira joergensenii TaxID=53329 RepID=UPI0003B2E7BD|nr:nucleotidyltransferase family protein [Desulfospira joergensenii]